MKKYGLLIFTYAATAIAIYLLYFFSQQQYGDEWLFSSFIVFIFSLFLLLWKLFSRHVIGVIVMTAYALLNINSVLYLTPNAASTIYVTFITGVLLVLYRKTATEGIVASLGLVLLNIAMHMPVSDFVITLIALGINVVLAAICWLKQWRIAKWLYVALIVINAGFVVLFAFE